MQWHFTRQILQYIYTTRALHNSHADIRSTRLLCRRPYHLLPVRVFIDNNDKNIHQHKKSKGFPYSLQSTGPGADPNVQAVSPQVTISHPPSVRLQLLSARPAVTFPAAEHHRSLAGTKLYCSVTEAYRCEQLAKVVTQLCPE